MSNLPTTTAAARIAGEVEAAEQRFEQTLPALSSEQQREFVRAFCALGDWRMAALSAGYNEMHLSQEVARLQRNPRIRIAIESGAALRSADLPPLTKQALVDRLWQMLNVKKTDYLVYDDRGQAVGLTDWHALPIAHQNALTKFKTKVYGPKGRHADYRDIDLECADPVRLADTIGRLMGWVKPAVNIAAAVQLRSPVGGSSIDRDEAESYYRLKDAAPETQS